MGVFWLLWGLIRALFSTQTSLAAENLVLRQQVIVLRRTVKRPRLRNRDRLFWILVCRLWKGWRSSLHVLQPATVLRWHRQGFRRYWSWRSRSKKPGRSKIAAEIRQLIKTMSTENPLWGAPRILSELQLLGYSVAERTVASTWSMTRSPDLKLGELFSTTIFKTSWLLTFSPSPRRHSACCIALSCFAMLVVKWSTSM